MEYEKTITKAQWAFKEEQEEQVMASFADYVKDLMGVLPQVNGNPMLSVTSMT